MLVVGVDIIELDRIAKTVERFHQRFLDRIYTPQEQSYCRGRIPQLAGRFAAKEAVMKALGTGRHGLNWNEIEVVRPRGRAPTVQLHGRALSISQRLGVEGLTLSISHSRDSAVAFVVGERR
ncbi:MAG: holo-[acyl-carrier-protein] synthase [Dehalococcoidia bacterium]|nr:holo-[acyl-carrier-protein] synthase [Dehalococcoidia bacterium]